MRRNSGIKQGKAKSRRTTISASVLALALISPSVVPIGPAATAAQKTTAACNVPPASENKPVEYNVPHSFYTLDFSHPKWLDPKSHLDDVGVRESRIQTKASFFQQNGKTYVKFHHTFNPNHDYEGSQNGKFSLFIPKGVTVMSLKAKEVLKTQQPQNVNWFYDSTTKGIKPGNSREDMSVLNDWKKGDIGAGALGTQVFYEENEGTFHNQYIKLTGDNNGNGTTFPKNGPNGHDGFSGFENVGEFHNNLKGVLYHLGYSHTGSHDGALLGRGYQNRYDVEIVYRLDGKTQPQDLAFAAEYSNFGDKWRAYHVYTASPKKKEELQEANPEISFDCIGKTADNLTPKYDPSVVTLDTPAEVTPTFTNKKGNPTTAPSGTKYKLKDGTTIPGGYKVTVDPATGKVTITLDKPNLNKNTPNNIDVPVTVTYPDGSTDDATAHVDLDTDGDGKNDNVDPDDDNDGINDTDEITAGTNPKDDKDKPAKTAENLTPKYDPSVVTTDTPAEVTPSFTNKKGDPANAPSGTKYKLKDGTKVPGGYTVTVDPDTGKVTITLDKPNLNKNTPNNIDVPVTITYPDGSTDDATAHVDLDTDGDGTPDATDPDDDNDGINDTDEITAGTNPKDDKDKPAKTAENLTPKYDPSVVTLDTPAEVTPSFTNKKGNPTTAPSGTKYKLKDGTTIPGGYKVTVDPDTGKITITLDKPNLNKNTPNNIDVPVTITYPDGSTDDATAHVDLDTDGDGTPDATDPDDDNDGINDTDEVSGAVNPFKDHKSDKNGEPGNTNPKDADSDNDGVTDGEELNTMVDKDGKTVTDPNAKDEVTNPNVPNMRPECLPAVITSSVPLVLLLPLGLLTQVRIPALAPLQHAINAHIAGINKQIEDANANLQRQLGIYNGPLAAQAKQISAILGHIGPSLGAIAGGILAATAGVLAITWIAESCGPKPAKGEGSTASFEGSSLSSKISADTDGNFSFDIQGSSQNNKEESPKADAQEEENAEASQPAAAEDNATAAAPSEEASADARAEASNTETTTAE